MRACVRFPISDQSSPSQRYRAVTKAVSTLAPHSCWWQSWFSFIFHTHHRHEGWPGPLCGVRLVFLSVSVRDPGFRLLAVQMTSGFPAPPEYWLQCLSVHYSSKLMMQGTTCCLQFRVWVGRHWQKRLVFCEQHVINSLGACSLRVDDYSLWYVSVYFWVHCTTSCAIFSSSSIPHISPDRAEGITFFCAGCQIKSSNDQKEGSRHGQKETDLIISKCTW